MRRSTPLAALLAVAILVLAAVAVARAETWPLEIKRQGAESRYPSFPQRFYVQIGDKGKSRLQFPGVEEQAAAFKRIVNKEPKYESKNPVRGVAKLGSREYAFALDMVLPKLPPAKPDSATAKLVEKLLEAFRPSFLEPTYNRLYFDSNCNGDLTDEVVVEAEGSRESALARFLAGGWHGEGFQFPQIDVTIDADGTKLDYSFLLSGYVDARVNSGFVRISLSAAACREGDIILEGKKHRVVLIDFNSNGRFDDQTTPLPAGRQSFGRPPFPQHGDVLLVDPETRNVSFVSFYDPAAAHNQFLVSKLVKLDGRFYDMQVSPAGDRLTLTPTARLGQIANPHDGFRATIYSDKGFLKIGGNKGVPIPVPEGQWKLLFYEIDLPDYWKSVTPPEEKGEKSQKDGAALLALANSLEATLPSKPRYTRVRAQATADCKPVVVRADETVTLPFGPPYTPVVTAGSLTKDKKKLLLSLSLIGSGGERCTGIRIAGGRPPKPEFTITDPEGKVVQQGNLKYG